ncbi:S-adenosyl-L-methionine-dependent methyltransferase [Endogone sp. FLAS-F59071]|nr:S-adenosyl-L-methionine-dependent methyltransferase [Endogone sp. FLAS-F59071]|eukprot:RUS22543.1 S-adenosyl-L-methionine-dependent methyltransferase [Endogone sp. FLAS-F59071]
MGSQLSKRQNHSKLNNFASNTPSQESNSSKPDSPNFVSLVNSKGEARSYHNAVSSAYFLPADIREQLFQVLMLSKHRLSCHKLAFNGNLVVPIEDRLKGNGGKVLDVGCGPGIWALEMAHDFDNVDVYAIDIVDTYPKDIKPPNVHFSIANVLEGLPFPDNYFDLVQVRTFVVALRATEWPTAVKEVYRVVKPGGYVQFVELEDLYYRLAGESLKFFDQMIDILKNAGFDPLIAKKIGALLKMQGFVNIKTPRVSLPVGPWKGEIGKMMMDDLVKMLAPVLGLSDAEYEKRIRKLFDDMNSYQCFVNWYGNHAQKPLEATGV